MDNHNHAHLIWDETILVDERPWADEYAEHLVAASKEGFRPLTYTEYVHAARTALNRIDQLLEQRYGIR